MKLIKFAFLVACVVAVSGFTECYKPVTNSGLPRKIRRVAVPSFQTEARGLRYRVASRFTEAVSREIIRGILQFLRFHLLA